MLTIQFVPYNDISFMPSEQKLDKLIDIVKKNKIVVMQGRLKPVEEAGLIQKTMENVGKDFRGVELCTVYPEGKDQKFFTQIRGALLKFIMGTRDGITIIGPATIVKQIKRNPDKIELLMHNAGRKR